MSQDTVTLSVAPEALATAHYSGEARLAHAVLYRACLDAEERRWGVHAMARARSFLRGGDMLEFWCEIGQIDRRAIVERSKRRWPAETQE